MYFELCQIAERCGLCCNCLHTLACCNETCWTIASDLDMNTHVCEENE